MKSAQTNNEKYIEPFILEWGCGFTPIVGFSNAMINACDPYFFSGDNPKFAPLHSLALRIQKRAPFCFGLPLWEFMGWMTLNQHKPTSIDYVLTLAHIVHDMKLLKPLKPLKPHHAKRKQRICPDLSLWCIPRELEMFFDLRWCTSGSKGLAWSSWPKIHVRIWINASLVGGFNPAENMSSSVGMIFHSQLNGKS